MAMKMHSERFEQATRSWIHGSHTHCDSNLSPFGVSVENTNTNNSTNRDDRRRDGILLTQLGESNSGEIVPRSDGITFADKKCFRSNKIGHMT